MPGVHNKVIHISAGLLKYVQPFSGHLAQKGKLAYVMNIGFSLIMLMKVCQEMFFELSNITKK